MDMVMCEKSLDRARLVDLSVIHHEEERPAVILLEPALQVDHKTLEEA